MLSDDYIVYNAANSSKQHKQNENTSEGQRIGANVVMKEDETGRAGKGSGWE